MFSGKPNSDQPGDDSAESRDVPVAAAGDELTAEQEIDLVRSQLAEARDKMLRAQAELENYRKRARRELDDERRYAEIGLLRDLLPVLDNVVRAIDASEKRADTASLLEGFKLVRQQLESVLERHHCRPIQAEGQPFDPAHHEAVMQQNSPDQPPSTVVGVAQTGYQLHDRVVRPAQVIVSKQE